MDRRGWDICDFVMISGDAYVDHPSFGPAVIGRVLESLGFRVGIIPQPEWKDPAAWPGQIGKLGRPRLAFLVTSGNIDSLVNHYTAAKKPRSSDAYSPGGEAGRRPDRAVIVYTGMIRRVFKDAPVILGGIEASLRRLAHYDYWSDKVRHSILLDSKADLLVYGMGETAIAEIARELDRGVPVREIRNVRGTCWRLSLKEWREEREKREGQAGSMPPAGSTDGALELPSFRECREDKAACAGAFKIQHENTNPYTARRLWQESEGQVAVQNPPGFPLDGKELDRVYELLYTRRAHPVYGPAGVPALREVSFSLTSSRGCFGSCSFCALTFHQGRIAGARTEESLVEEARGLTADPEFKGNIHDLGGPTANFFHAACGKQARRGGCPRRECLFPVPCPSLDADHRGYLGVLRRLRRLSGVKKVFIRSGIRYDYLLAGLVAGGRIAAGGKAAGKAGGDTGAGEFLRELAEHHVSGQLKVAPEHAAPGVLRLMGKPPVEVFLEFARRFEGASRDAGKKQYLIPYFISGHPGSTLKDAVTLAEFLRDRGFVPDQVQDFYPTPGTRSTVMYHTGLDPLTGEEVYVPRDPREKAMQRALLHFHKPENQALVREALIKAGRRDLIGPGRRCLAPNPGTGPRSSPVPGSRPGPKGHGRGRKGPAEGRPPLAR